MMDSKLWQFVISFFVYIVTNNKEILAQAPDSVSSPNDFIELIKINARSHMSNYPFGSIKVISEQGTTRSTVFVPRIRLEAKFVWSGKSQMTEGVLTEFGDELSKKPHEVLNIKELVGLKRYYLLDFTHHILTIRDARNGSLPQTRLSPNEEWWSILGKPLDALLSDKGALANVKRVTVTENRASKRLSVIIKQLDLSVLEVDFNSAQNFAPLRYSIFDAKLNAKFEGRFEWDRTSREKIYLKLKKTDQPANFSNPANGERDIKTIRILDPNFDDKPLESLFSIDVGQLQQGTVVDDQIRNKRYRIGAISIDRQLESLPRLIDKMKSKGFANPDNK